MKLRRSPLIVLLAVTFLAAPLAVQAQLTGKVYRIGLLFSQPNPTEADFQRSTVVQAFRDLGWVAGQNIVFERRYWGGNMALLPGFAQDLVRANVDVILAGSTRDIVAAKQATAVIPIVMISVAVDPVGAGFIESFAKPGGNVTGVSRMLAETDAKRLELIREIVPQARRIAVLRDLSSGPGPYHSDVERAFRDVAARLGVELQFVSAQKPDELSKAFAAMVSGGAQAFCLVPSNMTLRERGRIAELALEHRLPGILTLREYAEAGGLASYGPNLQALVRQAVGYADRILKGAKPGELPVEQPTRFELVINAKTAKALGVTIPRSLMLRADQIIE